VCEFTYVTVISDTFVPRSELNIIKPPFGDVLVFKNGIKNKIIIIIYSNCITFSVVVRLFITSL